VPLSVELTDDEREMIADWYEVSAYECSNPRTNEMFALLEKLGIPAHWMDLELDADNPAVRAYRQRHPEVV
jgi:hypothetical protein